MPRSTTAQRLSRSDTAGMYLTILLGAVGIAVTIFTLVNRLVEVVPGRDVPVLVPFAGERATLPIGPDGASVGVSVDQAVVTVPHPADATQFAIVAQPIVTGLAIIAGIVLLGLLCWNLAHGRAFTRQNTMIIWWGTAVLVVGWLFDRLFTTMAVNGALSAVSEYSYDGVLFEMNFTPLFGLLALAVVGAAFQLGERLQRDTEGLV
ncbi:hypothetical protein [Agromyces laixinhei]|uniref:hypothetical protein n=1 Tax=Agromyces laixinhei TaxID=2585717 RepID=UPI0011174225|nr:hypothetical protein [Agromyces laixinhei]